MEVSLPVAVWFGSGAGAQESWRSTCMRYALEEPGTENSRLIVSLAKTLRRR